MYLAKKRAGRLFLILILTGCGLPETRYLSCVPRKASQEIASYNFHDPFPDEEAGPKTATRPLAFLEPRTDTRKSLDQRLLKAAYGFPQQRYATWGPSTPVNMAQYPVQPLWRTSPPSNNSGFTW